MQHGAAASEIDTQLKQPIPASNPPSGVMGAESAAEERHQEQMSDQTVGDTTLKGEPKVDLSNRHVAILATDGFEQSELLEPKRALEEAGATTQVVSVNSGSIRGWSNKDWGESVPVDLELSNASPEDFDALVLPGGVMNPDHLRANARAVQFVRAFADANKPIAAICHGPWLLVEAGLVEGRRLTSWPSLKTDIRNAGGDWVDEEVVVDEGLITSRKPGDLPAFNHKLAELLGGVGAPRIKIGATNIS